MEWLILAAYSLQHTMFANVEESEKKLVIFNQFHLGRNAPHYFTA